MIGTRGIEGSQGSASMVTACNMGVVVGSVYFQASKVVCETVLGKKLGSSLLKPRGRYSVSPDTRPTPL